MAIFLQHTFLCTRSCLPKYSADTFKASVRGMYTCKDTCWHSEILYFVRLPHTVIFIHRFKVCKSVHHRTIPINHQPDATIFQFIILTFIYSSTRFGRFPAHHQELNDCSGSLWFYLRIVVTVVLCP